MLLILTQCESSYFNTDHFVSTVTAKALSNDVRATKT